MPFASVEMSVDYDDLSKSFELGLHDAAENTMRQLAEMGADRSREKAPQGAKHDKRTPHLKDSITHSSDANTASWSCTARHALIIEEGGGPSEITGLVSFFWEREGRPWYPNSNIIQHPPTAAKPYLKPALLEVMQLWDDVARLWYAQ